MKAIDKLREVLLILQERIENPNATKYINSDLKECYNTISTSIDDIESQAKQINQLNEKGMKIKLKKVLAPLEIATELALRSKKLKKKYRYEDTAMNNIDVFNRRNEIVCSIQAVENDELGINDYNRASLIVNALNTYDK